MMELAPECLKVPGLLERADTAGEYKIVRFEASFEKIKELASEQRRHHPYGKKKSSTAGYPGAIGR